VEEYAMEEQKRLTVQEWHKKSAIDLFNQVWGLLDTAGRSAEQDDTMVHAAHASRYHWGEIGTLLEFERGEWQVTRVYAVLKRAEPALYHARRCLEICQANEIGDFDIAFAYEAMARAHAVAGQKADRDKYAGLAEQAGEQIEDNDNRDYFSSELSTIPGRAG
jgi:hypothetical protein